MTIKLQIQERVYKYLYRRPHSEWEIEIYLSTRVGLNEQEVSGFIDKLKNENFVDDREFTRWFIEFNLRKSNINKNKLIRMLKDKRVPNHTLQSLLKKYNDVIVEKEKCNVKYEVKKQKQKLSHLAKPIRNRKIIQRLSSRGFQYSFIQNCLS